MGQQISIIFLFLFGLTWGQNTGDYRSWQFFDKDSIYYELTISQKSLYIYSDSSTVDRLKIKRKHSQIKYGNQTWFLDIRNDSTITITTTDKLKMKLYQANSIDNSLVRFYDWYHADNRNGNGVMIFYRSATERKLELLRQTQNGI